MLQFKTRPVSALRDSLRAAEGEPLTDKAWLLYRAHSETLPLVAKLIAALQTGCYVSTMHVLVTGAAGSGTSTLGSALAHELNAGFIEADDFYWLQTSPPFKKKRAADERRRLMLSSLSRHSSAVVAGSVMDWGEPIENAFDLVIFLYVETPIRLQRLRERELVRYGAVDTHFLDWAAQYDQGTAPGRSLARHQAWLKARSCRVFTLEGAVPLSKQIKFLKDDGLM